MDYLSPLVSPPSLSQSQGKKRGYDHGLSQLPDPCLDFDDDSTPPSLVNLISAYGENPIPVFFRANQTPYTFPHPGVTPHPSGIIEPWDKVNELHPFDLFHYLLEAPLSLGGLQLTSPLTIAAPANSATWTELIRTIKRRL